jgi:asparagine synthetase B (glutamine-hydrolysing)
MGGVCAVRGENAEYTTAKKMCGRLVHRGPDDEGVCAPIENLALGHRTLFVQDSARYISRCLAKMERCGSRLAAQSIILNS